MDPKWTPTLRLHEIILTNFKSYYGEQCIGPFHPGFNAIIGPNGSGKSNLIESLLFVFGKRARSLRANQLHHLIHNSSTHQHLGEASVEIVFHESRSDASQVPLSLKRTVYHTSLSKYSVNGLETTLETATSMLKSKGLDIKNNSFMVLQGEVEQVFLMKSKSGSKEAPGLLEFLEEIIGTSGLKEEMETIQDQLSTLDDKRIEYGERVRVARSTVEQLYPVVRASVLALSSYIYQSTFGNMVHQVRLLGLRISLQEYQANLHSTEESLRLCQREISDHQRRESRINEELHFVSTKKRRKVAKQVEINTQLSYFAEQNAQLRNQLGAQLDENQHLQEKTRLQEKEIEVLKSDLNSKRHLIPKKEAELAELLERKLFFEEDFKIRSDAIHDKTTELIRKKKELENTLYPHERKRLDLENELEMMKSQCAALSKDDKLIVTESTELAKKTRQFESQLEEIQLVIDKFQEIFQTIEQNKYTYIQKLTTAHNGIQTTTKEIQDLAEMITAGQQVNQENSTRYQLIKEIQRAAQMNEIPQICGRLGDLATISERYDVAITVACPALDNIVVKTSADAVQCIEFLKEHKLGRCTFIPIDKLPKEVEQFLGKPFTAPAGSKRLFDLLSFKDETYRPVFYNVLRDTLVADTVEDASYIAFRTGVRRRVVSMDGKLIEMSGVMSGGGKPRRGGMAAKFKNEISSEELIQLSKQKNRKGAELEQLQQQVKHFDMILNELQKDEQESKSRYKQNLIDQELLREQIRENLERDDLLKEQIKKSQERRQQAILLLEGIEHLAQKIERIRTRTEEDQFQIRLLDTQIAKVGGTEYEQLKDQLREASALFDAKEQEIQKIKAQVLSLHQKIDKGHDTLATIESDIVVVKDSVNLLERKLDDIEDQSLKLIERERKLLGKMELIDEEIAKKEQEIAQFRVTYAKIQQRHDTLEQDMRRYKELCNKLMHEQLELQGELTSLEEEYRELIGQYRHKDGNYLQDSLNDKSDAEELGFQQLYSKHYNAFKARYVQSIKEHFIPNLLNILPENTQSRLITYSEQDLEQLVKHEHTLRDIVKEHGSKEPLQCDANILIEYIMRSEEFKGKMLELKRCQDQYNELKGKLDDMRFKRKALFESGFRSIASKLREIYQVPQPSQSIKHLSGGGDADLDLIDSLDPFSEGVTFQVRPKNKTWKPLSKLSGGEKTLSSLSLLLSMHFYRPNSFYFFDEIDAALDYKNVGIVARYIKSHTHATQFSVISLRNSMFEEADKLIGIYKLEDCTQILPLDPVRFIEEMTD